MPYNKICPACGELFETDNFRKKKCKPTCGAGPRNPETRNSARALARENHEVEFIGVDGEGINVYEWHYDVDENGDEEYRRRKVHKYVLLSVGSKSLHKNGEELNYDDIFSFLWECFLEHPDAAFVGFFLGYDFTHWLKTLPARAARALLTKEGIARRKPRPDSGLIFPWPVRDGNTWSEEQGTFVDNKWEFDILGTKRFKLRPYVERDKIPTKIVTKKDGTQVEQREPRPWMYICDTGPFFQTSFLKVIKPTDAKGRPVPFPVVSQAEYDRIEKGKAIRSDAGFDEDMIEYNVLENEVLARVMTQMNEGLVADGIRLGKDQWYGPGAAAQAWMKLIGAPTGEEVRTAVPQYARDAGRNCYYGGWFEIFNHGLVPGTSYAYDINSAYPAEIETLPCLLHGKWTQGKGKPRKLLTGRSIRMVKAKLVGSDPFVGAAPHRNRTGSILRPQETTGWHWQHELDAAVAAGVIDKITVREWVQYDPCDCTPPFAPIRELYEGRLRVGKNTPSGKSKKLVYNSSYGKMAQSIGMPKFSNPIYASLITAGCRTRILNAIATHPTKTKSLLMIATDGIVFKEPHPTIDIDGERLGAWDEETYENLSLFMPGLYWDDKARADIAAGNDPRLKSRGVRAKDLALVIERADRSWKREVNAEWTPPVIELNIDWAQITAKQAINRDQWATAGMAVWNEKRIISGAYENKRDNIYRAEDVESWGGLRSRPYVLAEDDETTYYTGTFGETLVDEADPIDQMETPDGTVADVRQWMLKHD